MEIIGAGVLFLLLLVVLGSVWVVRSRNTRLDRAYHEALHAESVEDYVRATELFQAILDRYSGVLDEKIKAQIKARIDTMRYQKEYLKRFEERAKQTIARPS